MPPHHVQSTSVEGVVRVHARNAISTSQLILRLSEAYPAKPLRPPYQMGAYGLVRAAACHLRLRVQLASPRSLFLLEWTGKRCRHVTEPDDARRARLFIRLSLSLSHSHYRCARPLTRPHSDNNSRWSLFYVPYVCDVRILLSSTK